MAKLTCHGGAGTVTGANFLFDTGDKRVLVDCGMLQGSKNSEESNASPFSYEPASIDVLFITHAHIDHIGLVPKLRRAGFKGPIYSTAETKAIAELLLLDSARIAEESENPLYGPADVHEAISSWQTLEYHEEKDFGAFKVKLFDAGHILGSAMVQFTFPSGKSILFSGDIGNSPSLLLRDAEKVPGLEYLVMESVYGDRNHASKSERDGQFKAVIEKVVKEGRTLLIPAFSLERTQTILYELDNLFESKEVQAIPVFVDSPLAIRLTNIYEKVSKFYNEKVQEEIRGGDNIFKFPKLQETAQVRDSREILHVLGPKIIIAGSGMSTGGRILGHEETFLPDPKASILFVGYQAPGTLGRQILEGMKEVWINDHKVKVRAGVESIEGFSGHADSDALVKFASESQSTLKEVFVAMGEPRSSSFLAQRLRDELGLKAVVPEKDREYTLDL